MNALELRGIDGSNPLGMLAALGVLRVAATSHSDARMAWRIEAYPFPLLETRLTLPELAEAIGREALRVAAEVASEEYGDIISIDVERFRACAGRAIPERALPGDPADSDHFAAWASDAVRKQDKGKETLVECCGFSFSNGGSGQVLLKNYRQLAESMRPDAAVRNLSERDALLTEQSMTNLNWDPSANRSYALRWHNPEDRRNSPKRTNIALNVAAFLGLALLPAVPVGVRCLASTGMGPAQESWTWPLWKPALALPVVRSLLAAGPAEFGSADVIAVFRARRFSINKRFYFAPAEPVPTPAPQTDGTRP